MADNYKIYLKTLLEETRQINGENSDNLNEILNDYVDTFYLSHIHNLSEISNEYFMKIQHLQETQLKIWGKYFEQSYGLFLLIVDFSEEFDDYIKKGEFLINEEQIKVYETYKAIHVRIIETYLEILALQKVCSPEAALSRWRTMYELVCTQEFIASSPDVGYELAVAYHDCVETQKGKNWNWASIDKRVSKDDGTKNNNVSFGDISKNCENLRNKWKDYYKLSCNYVHASSFATFKKFVYNDVHSGISDTAVQSAHALCLSTKLLFSLVPSYGDGAVCLKLMIKLLIDLDKAYKKTEGLISLETANKEDTPCQSAPKK